MGRIWTVSTGSTGTTDGRHGDIAIYRYTPVSGKTAGQMGDPVVFTGNGDTITRRTVTGTKELPEGYQSRYIRTSGASGKVANTSTGEISPDWVSDVNWTVRYGSIGQYKVTDVSVVQDASECVRGGDSGGAVYEQSGSSGALAVGIISGTNNEGIGVLNCKNYYTPVKYIYFGGRIKTG
jgi:hypothetical protein